MTEKLLPCPFCGGVNVVRGGDDKMVAVFCGTCGACGPDEYGSSNNWNRRTPAPLSAEKVREWLVTTAPAMTSALDEYCPPEFTLLAEAYLQLLSTAAPPAPEGEAWRTVPVEPTEAMIAAANALWGEGTGVNYVQLEPEDFYAAMLAASPVVPVGVSRERVRLIVSGLLLGFTDFTVAEREAFIDRKTDAILAALRPTDTGRE